MGEIVAKEDTPRQCFARLRLENGDEIMISLAQSGVKGGPDAGSNTLGVRQYG